MKVLVAIAFVAILGSLASALFFMMRGSSKDSKDDKRRGDNMARALAIRIGVSVLLFICILVAWRLGYIRPTGIPVGK